MARAGTGFEGGGWRLAASAETKTARWRFSGVGGGSGMSRMTMAGRRRGWNPRFSNSPASSRARWMGRVSHTVGAVGAVGEVDGESIGEL